jgi:hypothetical protein
VIELKLALGGLGLLSGEFVCPLLALIITALVSR